ncbi:MAG TPA: cation-translocating P-type ATPase [Coriobacteriia bacterium]
MPTEANDIRNLTGLTETEAARRLVEEGPNEIASAKRRSFLRVVWEVVKEPMLLLLVAAGTVNVLISLQEPGRIKEALLLFVFVFVVIGITLYQERKTERALEALRDLSSPRALVIRDGLQRRIPGREVVRGDLILLAEGDRVPADSIMLQCSNISVDESLLTGESVPVRKVPCGADAPRLLGTPGGDGTAWVFSGTLVVKGQGLAQALATGFATELGKIGTALQTLEPERTLLQRDVDRLVRNLAIFGLSVAAVVVVIYSLTRGDWLEGTLAGITLAMALLPEEFPVVLTVFLALGAWRVSKSNVLTRRMPAIEMLGAATVLCSDKTGTITQNRMTVKELSTDAGRFCVDGAPLTEEFHEIVEYAVLASPIDPFDPMDTAFKVLGERFLADTEHLHVDWVLVREYPLSERLLALSHVWRSPDGGDYVIAAKGAPEAIADLCHMTEGETAALVARVSLMADEGLRVLGVAHAAFRAEDGLPEIQHDFTFKFIGLVGLQDPIREDVPGAVAQARAAGMRVVMITGDYPGTARSIAAEAGLDTETCIMTGPELEALDDEALAERIDEIDVFARVVPEQKLRIVRALKARGEVVAMTGDGVNDAPALKASHIGIAMGQRGTDVAREAAALVLTDDAFSSIVGAVRVGRRIYDNLKKAMAYILAVHVPIAGISLLPVLVPRLFGHEMPLVLMPVHIAFLELIIDPACSVVFEAEAEENDIMDRPPRGIDDPMFSRRMIGVSVAQGAFVLAAVLGVYLWAVLGGREANDVRALTFATLVFGNLALIFVNRSWSHTVIGGLLTRNVALWWITGGTIGMLALLFWFPATRELFQFTVMHPMDLVISLGAGIVSVVWFEIYKLVRHRHHHPVA